jgi:hypothetical protein
VIGVRLGLTFFCDTIYILDLIALGAEVLPLMLPLALQAMFMATDKCVLENVHCI